MFNFYQTGRRYESRREGRHSLDRHNQLAVVPDPLDVPLESLEYPFGYPDTIALMVLRVIAAKILQSGIPHLT